MIPSGQIGNVLRAAIDYRQAHKREFAPEWYPWQRETVCLTEAQTHVMLLAGNRTGKTSVAGFAAACHATGHYPEWWTGVRFDYPTVGWVFGVDSTQVKNVLQLELLGVERGESFEGGWIHPSEIIDFDRSHQPGGVSELRVQHPLGPSRIAFKSYSQLGTGQSTLPHAGSSVDWAWIDEQPPDELVGQIVTRLMTGRKGRGGLLMYTMTPELGLTTLVDHYLSTKRQPHERLVGPIPWSRCPHLTPEIRELTLASYPPHERAMRSTGVPMMGEGRVFTTDESQLVIPDFELNTRPWMRVIRSLDVGIRHPTSIAWLAYDPETDITYVVRLYSRAGEKAAVHAAVANSQWKHAPVVVPPDIDQQEKGSGELTAEFYASAGMTNTLVFANPDGSRYVEPGILAMGHAMETDRFKVFASAAETFLYEYRTYHRKDGRIVKERDDVMSAVRYGFQMVKQFGSTLNPTTTTKLYPQLGLSSRSEKRWNTRRA